MGKRVRCLLLACVAGLIVVATSTAGSDQASDLCKNDGYVNWTTAPGGAPFENQGRCVSFSNHGTLVPVAPPGPQVTSGYVDTVGCTGVITGSGFTGATDVTVNGSPPPFTVVSDSVIRIPYFLLEGSGQVTVGVTTPAGTGTGTFFVTFPNASV